MSKILKNRKESANFIESEHGISCSPATLAKYASLGGGPKFVKFGRIPYYDPDDLNNWVFGRMSQKVGSTSEYESVEGKAYQQQKLAA